MTGGVLIDEALLPDGFGYPPEFKMTVELGLVDFAVWNVMDKDRAEKAIAMLARAHPGKGYVPFAEQRGSDDIACWAADAPGAVVILEYQASSEDEIMFRHDDFFAWLKEVVAEMIDHIRDQVKYA